MKKIRLLALLLAILMIPFSVLFACKPDEDPDKDDDEDDDKDKDNTKQEVVLERDDDNDLEDGDLLNYHFNAAAAGRFPALKYSDDLSYMNIQKEPYVTNFAPAMDKTGALYRIEKKIDPATNLPTNDGCMLIKREKTEIASDPFVDILVEGAITGLQAQHMLQFDIRLEKGLMTSVGYVGLRKELSGSKKFQHFLYIQNGALYDCNEKLIYGEPSKNYKEGWHTVSILLNDDVDVECYDVYVDGTKVAASVKYNVDGGFWNYDEAKPKLYRISLGSGKDEEYLYLDNIKLRNGTVKSLGLNDAPSDILKSIPVYTGILDPLNDPFGKMGFSTADNGAIKDGKVKDTIFDFDSKLLLSNIFSVSKIKNNGQGVNDDEITDLIIDYGVFTGKYAEKSRFGKDNEEFTVWTEADNVKKHTANALGRISYDNDKTDEIPAVTGTYTIGTVGTVENVIKITWDEGVVAPVVGNVSISNLKCDDSQNLFIYSDAECTTTLDGAYVLSTTGDANYAKNLLANVQLAGDERLAIKYTNFYTSGVHQPEFTIEKEMVENSEYILFEFYASKEMIDNSYQFNVTFDCGRDANNKWLYSNFIFQPEKDTASGGTHNADGITNFDYDEGWNSIKIGTKQITSHAQWANFTGKMRINFTGWANGVNNPDLDENDNGNTIYFSKVAFVSYIAESLNDGTSNCAHRNMSVVGEWKECAHKPCQHGEFIVNKCMDCGYEVIGDFVGIRAPHTKGDKLFISNPTCEEDGYAYYLCTECGEHLKEYAIPALEHNMKESMDWTTLTRTAICENCGSVENTYFFDKLISAQEKIALYQIPDNQTFSYDSFDGKEPYAISGFNVINLKNSGTFTPFSENGVTGYEFARVDTDNPKQMRDAYFDILPGQRSAPYGIRLLAGRSFTFEMDLMLGKKGRGGVYPKWTVSMKDRGPDAGDIALFTMDENGNFAFTNTDFTMPLSETEFTNIAFYVEPQSNKIQLYVNGYFKAEKQMYSTAATAMKFMFCDTRFGYSGFSDDDVKKTEDELKKMSVYQTYANEAGGSFKFNNIMYYYSAGPGCSINPEFLERAEYSGDIELQDELFNAINFSPLNVKLCDVIAKLPAGVVTTKYVMEFKLTANNLNAGTLLEGWKTNAGISHYESLLYVGTDGKLYTVGDRLVSETCNVNIALAFDDIFGTVTVYVNGVELYNGTVSYTNDMYADDEAVITGFIFKKDRGAYQISDFSLYTGTALK